MGDPAVTLVIVNWNQQQLLRQCLASIVDHAGDIPCEIIVVDNASTDGSQEMVAAECPSAHVIANSENCGYPRALNQGLRAAHGRFILLLNNDVLLLPGSLAAMVAFMEEHPDAGVIGCRLFTDRTCRTTQPSAFRVFPTPWNDLLDRVVGSRLSRRFPDAALVRMLITRLSRLCPDNGQPQPAASVVGAAMMTRREVIEQGLFLDEQFYMYLEETDWCRQLRTRGWNIYYVPQAQVVHFFGGSSASEEARRRRNQVFYESYLKYLRKHEGPLAVGAARAVHVLARTRRHFLSG